MIISYNYGIKMKVKYMLLVLTITVLMLFSVTCGEDTKREEVPDPLPTATSQPLPTATAKPIPTVVSKPSPKTPSEPLATATPRPSPTATAVSATIPAATSKYSPDLDPDIEFAQYQNTEFGISLKYPKSWSKAVYQKELRFAGDAGDFRVIVTGIPKVYLAQVVKDQFEKNPLYSEQHRESLSDGSGYVSSGTTINGDYRQLSIRSNRKLGLVLSEYNASKVKKDEYALLFAHVDKSIVLPEDVFVSRVIRGRPENCLNSDPLCVEIVAHNGISESTVAWLESSTLLAMKEFPLTVNELVAPPESPPSVPARLDRLGVIVWHPEHSNSENVAKSLCRFLQSGCSDGNIDEGYRLYEHGMICKCATGGAHPLGTEDWIIKSANYYKEGPDHPDTPHDWVADGRKIHIHEFFHIYQNAKGRLARVQAIRTGRDDPAGIEFRGPSWLAEGSAEYAGFHVISKAGLHPIKEQLAYILDSTKPKLLVGQKRYGIADAVTRHDWTKLDSLNLSGPIIYDLGVVATAYAISLSSYEAMMVDYWDDLNGLGSKESFRKNIGLSFEQFYIKFAKMMELSNSEILEILGYVQ